MNASTVILNDSQGSLRQIDSKTGNYIGAGSVYEYWGVRDWISSNPNDAYNANKKIIAFGEIANSIPQVGNIWKGIWDIRFVDDKGNILKEENYKNGERDGEFILYTIGKNGPEILSKKNYRNSSK
jgi:antitoxin component YwqK of YwqJK toxin-antitoxin module